MTKRALTILAAAVLTVAALTALIASSVGGDASNQPVHMLPSGETHTGEMPTTTHQMEDGESMEGTDDSGGTMDMDR